MNTIQVAAEKQLRKMSSVYCFLVNDTVITLLLNVEAKHTLSRTKLHRTASTLRLQHETSHSTHLFMQSYCS